METLKARGEDVWKWQFNGEKLRLKKRCELTIQAFLKKTAKGFESWKYQLKDERHLFFTHFVGWLALVFVATGRLMLSFFELCVFSLESTTLQPFLAMRFVPQHVKRWFFLLCLQISYRWWVQTMCGIFLPWQMVQFNWANMFPVVWWFNHHLQVGNPSPYASLARWRIWSRKPYPWSVPLNKILIQMRLGRFLATDQILKLLLHKPSGKTCDIFVSMFGGREYSSVGRWTETTEIDG